MSPDNIFSLWKIYHMSVFLDQLQRQTICQHCVLCGFPLGNPKEETAEIALERNIYFSEQLII